MSDIQELFQRDPLQLTKPDTDEIVAYYRDKRNAFNLGDKTAGATKKMIKKDPAQKLTSLELEDILRDL